MLSPRTANAILVIVTAVWVTSFVVSLLSQSYRPDPQINVIFMAIVGAAWAHAFKQKGGGDSK